jgi:hypothetical protein
MQLNQIISAENRTAGIGTSSISRWKKNKNPWKRPLAYSLLVFGYLQPEFGSYNPNQRLIFDLRNCALQRLKSLRRGWKDAGRIPDSGVHLAFLSGQICPPDRQSIFRFEGQD